MSLRAVSSRPTQWTTSSARFAPGATLSSSRSTPTLVRFLLAIEGVSVQLEADPSLISSTGTLNAMVPQGLQPVAIKLDHDGVSAVSGGSSSPCARLTIDLRSCS